MTTRSLSSISVMVVAGVLLAACSETPGADKILALPEAVQRQAHLVCQAEQGVNIPEAINVLRLNDGRVVVSVVNGPGLSLSQARAINQCARTKLLSEPASSSSTLEPTLAIQPVREPNTAFEAVAGCVQGGGVLQGGTAICPGY
jgi:hypothetical protein